MSIFQKIADYFNRPDVQEAIVAGLNYSAEHGFGDGPFVLTNQKWNNEDSEKKSSGSSGKGLKFTGLALCFLGASGTGCNIDRSHVIFDDMEGDIGRHVNGYHIVNPEGQVDWTMYSHRQIRELMGDLPAGYTSIQHPLPQALEEHLRDSLGPAFEDSLRASHGPSAMDYVNGLY